MKIVSIGDSLTNFGFNEDGWATKLIKTGKYTIENVGINGITSSEMLNKIPSSEIENKIIYADLITLWLGTNDVLQYYNNNITTQEYIKNIFLIIQYIKNIDSKIQILLIGLPSSSFSINKYISKEHSMLFVFNNELLKFSEKTDIPMINLMNNTDNQEIMVSDLYDGIHFNINGHNKLFNKMNNFLINNY